MKLSNCLKPFTAIALTALNVGAASANDGGQDYTQLWLALSRVNEPANQPSKRAAKVATQGLSKAQIKAKHLELSRLYKEASPHIDGTARQILKREIQLLYLAGAN